MPAQAARALRGEKAPEQCAVPLLLLDEHPQRLDILRIQDFRAFQQAPALRAFSQFELLDGLDDHGAFGAAQTIAIIPRQAGRRGVGAEIPDPIAFGHESIL